MGRAPRPGAVARLADLRRVPPRRGPQSNRRGNRTECVLGVRGPHPSGLPLRTRRHRDRTRCARARPHGRVRRTRRATTRQPSFCWSASRSPAVSIVKSVRRDQRLAEIMIGAPAGQPEFAEWSRLLGDDSVAVPFLRYLPERLSPLGARVETALRERLAEAPSFVAFEGYDTVVVLADMLRSHGSDRARIAESWPRVAVEGTRGQIQFSRPPGISVWQWAWPPTQVVDRDPAKPDRFRVLHAT